MSNGISCFHCGSGCERPARSASTLILWHCHFTLFMPVNRIWNFSNNSLLKPIVLRSRFLGETIVWIQALHLFVTQIGKLVNAHFVSIGLRVVTLDLIVVLRENLKTRSHIRFGSVCLAILCQEVHKCLLFLLMDWVTVELHELRRRTWINLKQAECSCSEGNGTGDDDFEGIISLRFPLKVDIVREFSRTSFHFLCVYFIIIYKLFRSIYNINSKSSEWNPWLSSFLY